MSELKAFDVGLGQYCKDGSPCVVAFDADQNPRLLNEKVYLKSEADKVIAYQKYKRCLAMAMWCWAIKELNRFGDQDYMDFAEKWRKRWLELAKKFKHNNGVNNA